MPSIEDLRKGWLKLEEITAEEVALALERAYEEWQAARELVARFPSPAYELAYNAMLLAAIALLYSSGYRARVERHHKTLVDFTEARAGTEHASLVDEFEKARRKRHRTIYGQLKVSRREAEHIMEAARQFIAMVESLLEKDREGKGRSQDGG